MFFLLLQVIKKYKKIEKLEKKQKESQGAVYLSSTDVIKLSSFDSTTPITIDRHFLVSIDIDISCHVPDPG